MDYQLSNGAIAKAMRDEEVENPVFQILGFKKIAGQAGADRFRLHISDGVNSHSFAMLATQLNHLVQDNALENYSIIRVDKMICNTMNNKRIMIILHLDVIAKGTDVGAKIGNPIPWQDGDAGSAAAPSRPTSNLNGSALPKNEPSSFPSGNSRGSLYGNKSSSSNRGSMDMSVGNTMPIQDINPYAQKLPIRARVTNKGDIRTWSNSKGEGKLFSMDLLDDSGEIRLTAFNASVDQFYDMIELDNVYYISKFSVKTANKQYTSIRHDYEISCVPDTQITPCLSDSSDIPKLQFDFMKIGNIENAEKDQIIDVLGICKKVSDVTTILQRSTQKELRKREITLVDDTNKEISLTLWGKTAEEFQDDSQSVIAVKGAKVSDFGGRSLSVTQSSVFQVNPDIPEAHTLRGWYDNEGSNMESQSLSGGRAGGPGGAAPWKVLREANAVEQVDPEKGDYFKAKVTLMAIRKENVLYKACSSDTCNKKVVDLNDGMYRCEKCNTSTTNFKWQLMVSADFADFTDHLWATSFRETGEIILGQKADVLGPMSQQDPDEFQAILSDALFSQYIIKFRSRMETYNNETRIKFTVQELQKVNYAEYSKKLLAELKETAS